MSEIAQWIVVTAIVAGAVVYLLKRLRPSGGNCCSGCPYAGSCNAAKDKPAECTPCPTQSESSLRS